MIDSRLRRFAPWIAVPALGMAIYLSYIRSRPTPRAAVVTTTLPGSRFTNSDMAGVAELVAAAYAGDERLRPQGQRMGEANHGIYVALRQGGRLHASMWQLGSTVGNALIGGMRAARERMGEDHAKIDTVEICVTHTYRNETVIDRKQFMDNVHRGIRGIELHYRGATRRHSPTELLARNLSFAKALTKFQEQEQISDQALASGAVSARSFECEQILVVLGPPPRATLMQRGNRLIAIDQVTRESVVELERLLGDWMVRNVHEDGRATYKWWPSRAEESPANNMIRQWMGTIALVRLAHARAQAELFELAARNIRYNLANFYHVENGHGLIEHNGKVKLGAVALAAIAIVEHPARADFAAEERALVATTFFLHNQQSGAFKTFYKPAGRSGQNNFYPGETLLLWSILYKESRDPELLARIMKSFHYYRDWHRKQRNPAFIPWHTQAYFRVWEATKDAELRDFVFEMSDWLLGIQEWSAALYPDTQGRFYDAKRSFYGPPHASATGVYLEGLIDAFRLAVAVGDADRRERYRQAIVRGLRSVMQLQFVDDVDMYYVTVRDPVYGGLRTTVYDNAIRIDNVQHNLLGIFRIVRELADADYRP